MKKRIFVVVVCARYCVVVDPAQHPEVQILQFRMLLRLLRQKTRRLLHQRARRFQTAVSGAQDLS